MSMDRSSAPAAWEGGYSMTPARIAILIVALVAAVGLAFIVHGMFATPKAPAPVVAAAAPAIDRKSVV